MRSIRVGIAGLGFVGKETVRLLRANREKFAKRLGVDIVLAAVADRRAGREAKALGLGSSIFRSADPIKLAARPDIDIAVELLGGLEAPKRFVLEALRRGKHVVTANKRLLSHEWPAIRRAQAERGGKVFFEASVAGSIPVIQALDSSLAANTIEALYGILNGTTNYILCALARGQSQAQALAEAQRLGFAEKDPGMDLSGRDTAHKLSVLATLVTGSWIDAGRIHCQGIEDVDREDMEFAQEQLASTIRLVGRLGFEAPAVEASVAPAIVDLDHPLAGVHGPNNALLVRATPAGDLMFYGPGAGPKPAASAVVGDIFLLSRDILCGGSSAPALGQKADLIPAEKSFSAFYLRLHAQDRPGVLAKVTKALAGRGISIAAIHQSRVRQGNRGIPVVITTHPASFGALRQSLKHILGSGGVSREYTLLRILA